MRIVRNGSYATGHGRGKSRMGGISDARSMRIHARTKTKVSFNPRSRPDATCADKRLIAYAGSTQDLSE